MFNNAGRKIKGLALVIFWILVIGSVVLGIIAFSTIMDLIENGFLRFLLTLVIIGLLVLIAWLVTILLYGFGELIEKTSDIDKFLRYGNSSSLGSIRSDSSNSNWLSSANKQSRSYDNAKVPLGSIKCPDCGSIENATHTLCYNCGAKLK